MPDLSEIRLRPDAQHVRWVLFIDGIAYAWTTDNGQGPGSLLGSGASSWIGLSEASIGGVETVGARTVLPGLEVPRTIPEQLNPKSGDVEPRPITFRLHDDESNTLAQLFAREGKDFDILRERIGAGTTALPATALGNGGAIGIRGRNIGIERTGSAGERRLFPALPETLVGHEHSVHQDAIATGGLPPIFVSDEPLQWAGRLVTLYAIYRDPDDPTEDASAWPTWDDQHDAGNRRWFGKVMGVTRIRRGVFELTCHGRDGMFRKQLGRVTDSTWQPITADRNRGSDDSGFAVIFEARYNDGSTPPVHFNGSVFDTDLTGATSNDIIDEINAIIGDAIDGTSTNYAGGAGDLDAWQEAAVDQDANVEMQPGGTIALRKADVGSDQSILVVWLAAHARDWRAVGFEPETQHVDLAGGSAENEYQAQFRQLDGGENLIATYDTGIAVPGDGYWLGRFTTVREGYTEDLGDGNFWDNDGNDRVYYPKYPGGTFTLDVGGLGQIFRLIGTAMSPYIEGQLGVWHSGEDVDGNASERARYFALRGKVQLPGGEPTDTVQVVRAEWSEANYGVIDPGTGASPALRIAEWLDPRLFGLPFERLEGLDHWTGYGDGEGAIEAAPLHAYSYIAGGVPSYAHNLWSQILLSTGSSAGYSGLSIADGDNAPSGSLDASLFWGSDVELADMACGVPYQLVTDLQSVRDAFNEVPGGWTGALNRVAHAYIGPFLAQDVLAALMRPRRLMWSFHGDVLGVVQLAPFAPSSADVTINESDLYAPDDDPRSLEPDQMPNPAGYLDGVQLLWRWDPAEGKTREQLEEGARDGEASHRTGERVEKIKDGGLLPHHVLQEHGIGPWIDEFRQLWGHDAAEFFSLDHYAIRLNVSRPKAQDIRLGTRVLLNNPWPADNAGSYGLVNHVGIVIGVEPNTETHAAWVEMFVFAGQSQGLPHYAPMARIVDQAGAAVTLSTDQYGHGDSSIQDGDGFVEPATSSIGGAAHVRILYRIGETFAIGGSHEVVSYDPVTAVLTLNSAPDTSIEYADRWVMYAPHEDQDANEFPRTIFGAVVREDLTHGAGSTVGRRFLP